MKYQILAGTLGLVLLLGMSPLPQAEAKVFLIDDFSQDPMSPDVMCADERVNIGSNGVLISPVMPFNATVLGVLGGYRVCQMTIDAENPDEVAQIAVQAAPDNPGTDDTRPDMFRHAAGPGVQTITTIEYDANTAGLNGGAGINLLSSDDVRLVYETSDFPVNIIVRLTDSGGDWAEQTGVTEGLTDMVEKTILFLITDFVDAPSMSNGVLNLDAITAIKFTFDTTSSQTDYVLNLFDITMEMVGGEMFPVDTTALLLAGAQLNAIWILPAIAAIGIGAFIVSRKRN